MAKGTDFYEEGLNDAWECARRILFDESIPRDILKDLGVNSFSGIIYNCSASEVIAKLKEYEKNDIQIMLDDSIDKLEFSTRTNHYLKRAGFYTIGDIINKDTKSADSQWIFKVRHIGKKSAEEIRTKLADKYNYTLKYWRDKP